MKLQFDSVRPGEGRALGWSFAYFFCLLAGFYGALAGPALAVWLAVPLGPANLLVIAAVLLEAAVLCVKRLESVSHNSEKQSNRKTESEALGGGWFEGIAMLLRSPYLAGIALWVSLLSIAGTFLYFQQANIVAAASDDPAVRTRMFASIDLAVGLLTVVVQFFATGKLIGRFGVGAALAFLPFVFAAGFAALAAAPMLAVVIGFQALQRTANFAISNPAREVLFTSLAREEKYKAKNVIDIVVFRGADAAPRPRLRYSRRSVITSRGEESWRAGSHLQSSWPSCSGPLPSTTGWWRCATATRIPTRRSTCS